MVGMCVCQNKIVYFFNVKSIKICGNFIVCVYISGINQDSMTAAGYKLTISLTDVQIAYHKRICVCTRSLIHSGITVNRTPSRKYLSREICNYNGNHKQNSDNCEYQYLLFICFSSFCHICCYHFYRKIVLLWFVLFRDAAL